MRNLAAILTILTLILLPRGVQAQAPITLTSVSVDLWPEYDQPGVLVIYHIQLDPQTSLPTTLPVQIPASAQINAVAVIDPAKGLINAPYETKVDGDWSTLNISINSLQVQVECYIDLNKNGATRHIVFKYAANLLVKNMDVNFLEPPGSSNVSIAPTAVTSEPGQGGFTNYRVTSGPMQPGYILTVNIDYQRQTDELGISSLPVQAISTPGASTPGLTSSPSVLPWALGGLGVLLVAGGLFGFFGWRRGGSTSRKAHARVSAAPEPEIEAVYCGECGKRAQPGDIFCRTCGAKLRTSEP